MVIAAKECGCDAVKFQSWSAESLYCRDYYDNDTMSEKIFKRFSLSEESLLEMARFCKQIGIDFSSTPYSEKEVDFLVKECNVPFVKIASMDINNIPFLQYIGKQSIPTIISTGMATMDEIEKGIATLENAGASNICILHCVSLYPAREDEISLNNMVTLKNKFPKYEVGYSDHTLGSEAACVAVALGASIIEKHFTLDNKTVGFDNRMATDPDSMKLLVSKCHLTHDILGRHERIVSQSEIEQSKKMRRSIVANKYLPKGHILTMEDITAKRPGTGISIADFEKVIGRKLKVDVNSDYMITWDMLS
ncbi:MAG: N-acetylneuraminate synthase family protein [Selenomonadaceae bacterium]|nr:N-acetylneuraminate synthase family protein [Selenomonadaceae bacterium]